MSGKKRAWLSLAAVLTLALAIACGAPAAPAAPAQPVAPQAPAPVADTAAAVAVVEEEAAVVTSPKMDVEVAKGSAEAAVVGGTILNKAGMKIFVPDGYALGGPTIPADPREPVYGGSITFASQADLPNLDPTRTTSVYMQQVTGVVYERLVHWNARAGHNPGGDPLEPGLAESWTVSEDGLTYNFKLRQGVKWQDVAPVNGREFSADDVVFSIGYLKRSGSFQAATLKALDTVTKKGPYEVEMKLSSRSPGFIFQLSNIGPGYIVPEEVVAADGDLSKVVIGTGPYITVGDYRLKIGQDYTRNPNYWEKDARGNQLPYLDGYKHRVIGDQSARIAAFRTGKLDTNSIPFGIDKASELIATNPNVVFQEIPAAFGSNGYHFRLDKAPYNDVNVRRAMSLAVDYDGWSQNWWGIPANLTILARGFFLGSVGGVPEDDTTVNLGEWYQYDPEKAKQLLATAGYPNGVDITLEYPARSPRDTEWAELMKFYWDAAGFRTTLRPLEYTVYRGTVDSGSWNEITWSFAYPLPLEVDSMVDFADKDYAGNATQGHLIDDKLTELARAFHVAYGDDSERLRILTEFRNRYVDNVYCVCTPWGHLFISTAPWLRNVQLANYLLGSRNDQRALTYGWIDNSWRQ